jgi:hydrogenase maturation factor
MALAILVVIGALMGMINKSEFKESQRKQTLFLMISSDIMLLIGLILYFNNGWFSQLTSNPDAMKVKEIRQFALEHALMMIIAWVLVHIGYAKIKKAVGTIAANKTTLIYTGIAIALIIASIPWASRPMFR